MRYIYRTAKFIAKYFSHNLKLYDKRTYTGFNKSSQFKW